MLDILPSASLVSFPLGSIGTTGDGAKVFLPTVAIAAEADAVAG